MQQDRLAELQRAKSTDAERAQLKNKLLSVTDQRADIAQHYAVRTHSAQMALWPLTALNRRAWYVR
jgi:hypothetical protein